MVSFKGSEMTEGLWDGGIAIIAKVYTTTTDYNGKLQKPETVVCMDLEPEDDTQPFTQMYSVGKGWVPDKAGTGLDSAPGAKKEKLSGKSNAGMLIRSLLKPLDNASSGVPENEVGDDLSVFNGIKAQFVRRERPKFTGQQSGGGLTKAQAPQQQKEGPDTILLVADIIERGGKKSKTAAKAAPAKGKPAPEPEEDAVDPAIRKRASKMVVAELKEEEGGMTAVQLGKAIFKKLKGDEDQAAITALVNDEDFLKDSAAPWEYDGEIAKL